ncbi:MAG TPA: cation:proton antiporter [Terriglobales bacterium]|nr:cation:proton antiporter [Terriglobales bacterium]
MQVIVIVTTARLLGAAFRKIHQPPVIGEIVAGILLGPSVLGWLAPSWSSTLFPPQSLGILSLLSEVGIVLFMFIVGLELDTRHVRDSGRFVILTSNVSIAVPFALGVLVAYGLHPLLANGTPTVYLALFMGAAMSITAFPVLARILSEGQLLHTRVGNLALACAAVDDISAWCILAVIVSLVHHGGTGVGPWIRLTGLPLYVLLMLFVIRPMLRKVQLRWFSMRTMTVGAIGFIAVYAFASSLITDWLGFHALFGAFFAGVVFPRERGLEVELGKQLKFITTGMLLPLFFAISGLRTNVGLIHGWPMWLTCALLITVAIIGKMLPSMLSARFGGMSWRESATLGVLMNTRGLVELVILNVGFDLGVLSQTLFSMMVLMALITTFMAAPLLHWINDRKQHEGINYSSAAS